MRRSFLPPVISQEAFAAAIASAADSKVGVQNALIAAGLLRGAAVVTPPPAPTVVVPTDFSAFAARAEASAYAAAMSTTPAQRRIKSIDRFIGKIKGRSIEAPNEPSVWDAARALPNATMVLTGTDEDHFLINLLNPADKMTKVGSPTFASNLGASHTAGGNGYDMNVTLASLSGRNVSAAVFTNSRFGAAADAFDMGALDGGTPSAGLSIVSKGSTTGKAGFRALSGNIGPTSSADYWSGEGLTGFTIEGDKVHLEHHGKRIETMTRTGTTTFTSTNKIRVLGATGSTSATTRQVSCSSVVGGLTEAQSSWLAACIRTLLEDIMRGDVDVYDAKQGPAEVIADLAMIGCTLGGIVGANVHKELWPNNKVVLLGTEMETRVMHMGGMSRAGLTYVDSSQFNNNSISGRYRDVLTWINTEVYNGADVTSQEGLGVDPKYYGYAVRRMLDPTRTGSASKVNGQAVPVYFSRGVKAIHGTEGNYTIVMHDGRVVRAKYIGGTEYTGSTLKHFPNIETVTGTEGFTLGAPNSGGQESYNGFKGDLQAYRFYPKNKANNNAVTLVDPWVKPGDPTSGLLPLIEMLPNIPINAPDPVSQPMNQRHTVTNSLSRYAPWPTTAPEGYNPLVWEPNFRWYAKDSTVNRDSICVVRPGRAPAFDMNNAGPFSTDMPGSGLAFTNAAAADLAAGGWANTLAVRKAVMQHGKSFFWHILGSNDPRVPAALKASMAVMTMDATQFCDPDPSLGETLHYAPACGVYERDPSWRIRRQELLPFSGQDMALANGAAIRPANRACVNIWYWVDRHMPRRVAVQEPDGTWAVVGQGEYFEPSGGSNGYAPIAYDHFLPDKTSTGGLFHVMAPNVTAVGWSALRMEPFTTAATELCVIAAGIAMEAGNIKLHDVDYEAVRAKAQGGHDRTVLALSQTA